MAELLAPVGTWELSGQDIMPEVERNILYDDLDWSPLATILTSANGIETVENTVYSWPEERAVRFSATLTGSISAVSAGTTQDVTFNVANIVIGEIFYHSGTKQQFQVVAFVSHPTATQTTVTIVRIAITLATLAVAGTPTLIKLSDQIAEGGWYPMGKGSTPTWLANYTQILANTVAITKTNKKVRTWYGNQFQKDMYQVNRQHRSNLEANLWWGQAINEMRTWTNEDGKTSTGQFTQSQGIDSRIQTHSTSYSGTLTEDVFNTWLEQHVWPSRNSGSMYKLLVCGPGIMRALNSFAVNRLHTLEGGSVYGMNIREYLTWGGRTLSIMEEKHFYDNSDYANTCYAIEPDMIGVVALGEYMSEVYPAQPPDRDIEALVYRTEGGWKIKQEAKMAKLFQV